ncbi:hypothetical protein [Campylobacter concisus]|nr:hypothetical protein [Campylobacter concisus]
MKRRKYAGDVWLCVEYQFADVMTMEYKFSTCIYLNGEIIPQRLRLK